jgi:hypothetical protein
LLEAGADPNEGDWTLLVRAVRRGCAAELVRLLAASGAELDRRGGEWSTPPEQYRTAYQNAILCGREDIADPCALRGHLESIVDALGPNFFGHVGGGPPGMLLHHACWRTG